MVMSVTGQGRSRLKAGRAPFAHMNPTKTVGEFLQVNWSCTNSGDAPGSVYLVIFEATDPLDGANPVLGGGTPMAPFA